MHQIDLKTWDQSCFMVVKLRRSITLALWLVDWCLDSVTYFFKGSDSDSHWRHIQWLRLGWVIHSLPNHKNPRAVTQRELSGKTVKHKFLVEQVCTSLFVYLWGTGCKSECLLTWELERILAFLRISILSLCGVLCTLSYFGFSLSITHLTWLRSQISSCEVGKYHLQFTETLCYTGAWRCWQ